MKTLYLLRHAKAAREGKGGDIERPLAPEGQAACERLGRFLATAGIVPAAQVTSPALRARETLERVAEAAGWPCSPLVRPLYEVGSAAVLHELRLLPAEADSALVVGHQPAWSDTVARLIGGGALRMSTGSVACVALEVHAWGEIVPGRGELQWLLGPKLLAPPENR
jgi:phosphohistidine phosphatase